MQDNPNDIFSLWGYPKASACVEPKSIIPLVRWHQNYNYNMSSKQVVSYVQFREDSNPLLMSLIDVLVASPTNEGENPGKIKVSQQFTQ